MAAGEPEELPVEVLLQEDCAAAVDPGVRRGGVKAGSDDSITDPPVVQSLLPFLPHFCHIFATFSFPFCLVLTQRMPYFATFLLHFRSTLPPSLPPFSSFSGPFKNTTSPFSALLLPFLEGGNPLNYGGYKKSAIGGSILGGLRGLN